MAALLAEVDGVILADWLSENPELRQLLTTSGKRSVVLRHRPATFPYDFAAEDKAEAFRLLAAHLAALGHRRIAFVSNLHDTVRWRA